MSKGLVMGLIGALLLLFVGVAGLGYMVLMRPAAAATAPAAQTVKATASAAEAELSFLKLKNFVTDLADKDRARYVDVTVAIGVKDETTLETVKKQETQIRDIILTQLRTCMAADLMGAAGKEKLTESLKEPLTKLLKENLKGIFITDLVVQ